MNERFESRVDVVSLFETNCHRTLSDQFSVPGHQSLGSYDYRLLG